MGNQGVTLEEAQKSNIFRPQNHIKLRRQPPSNLHKSTSLSIQLIQIIQQAEDRNESRNGFEGLLYEYILLFSEFQFNFIFIFFSCW